MTTPAPKPVPKVLLLVQLITEVLQYVVTVTPVFFHFDKHFQKHLLSEETFEHHTAFWRRVNSNAAHTADTRTDSSHIEKWPVLSYNKWAAENDAAEGGNLFAERSGYRYLKITLP